MIESGIQKVEIIEGGAMTVLCDIFVAELYKVSQVLCGPPHNLRCNSTGRGCVRTRAEMSLYAVDTQL